MATFRVEVEPALLDWAIERSQINRDELFAKKELRDFDLWVTGTKRPTYVELKKFAQVTHAPFGMFFLREPPVEKLPIPDFRTIANTKLSRPSPDLLETIYIAEQRQEWYRNYAERSDYDELPFIGSASINDPVEVVADKIRRTLEFTPDDRARDRNWSEALRRLIDSAEEAGVLVMVSGIVGNNTRRVLNPDEFRGFALSDTVAPVIFINGLTPKPRRISPSFMSWRTCGWASRRSQMRLSMPHRPIKPNCGAIASPLKLWCRWRTSSRSPHTTPKSLIALHESIRSAPS
jgi:hypothetical protein